MWNILVTNDKMTDKDAYDIVKLIVEKKADLVAVHKDAAKSFSVENQIKSQLADPVAARRGEIFRREGRQDVNLLVSANDRATAPLRRGRLL